MQKQCGHREEDPVTRGMQERGAGEGEGAGMDEG